MIVYFTNNRDKKQIGIGETFEECYKIITEFLKETYYEAPYWRISKYPDHEWIDVGSYSEFFEIWWGNNE